ncbi:P-loop containing nucleoside triphosphate hydrolase protein [Plectosphaerella plurivora]|uniref:P-loop containing nucleoside triphosphate hydrolase protein n=1 Tax=Plectosphaerella plurivora TaxID=936078 RepID=A0A9P8V0N4_9PEZI|nr:P-loop containing nucleoside triphosphate hydrolase protein [Plectosphaerella plurivora]
MTVNPHKANLAYFKLLPYQAVDVNYLLEQEKTLHATTILANDVGTGKTATFLMLVVAAYRQIEEMRKKIIQKSDTDPVYRPTLLIIPSNLVFQTYETINTIFDGLLIPKLFYGTKQFAPSHQQMAANTIDPDEFGAFMDALMRDKENIETGKTIIITTYNTVTRRLMTRREERFRFNSAEIRKRYETRFRTNQAHSSRDKAGKPIFWKDDISLCDITPLPDGATGHDGVQISWELKAIGELLRYWARIMLDEAHNAKKRGGSMFQFLLRELAAAFHFITATPMMHSIGDLINPLLIAWKQTGIDGFYRPSSVEVGDLQGLYHEDYNPYKKKNVMGDLCTRGIFHPSNLDTKNKAVMDMKAEFDNRGTRIWILSPALYTALGDGRELSDYPLDVVRRVLRTIQRRRRMYSPLKLPDGTTNYPAQKLKEMKVRFAEVPYAGPYQAVADSVMNAMLSNQGGEGNDSSSGYVVDERGQVQDAEERTIFNHVARMGAIVSHDLENAKIDKPTANNGIVDFLDDRMIQLALWNEKHPGKEPPRHLADVPKKLAQARQRQKDRELAGTHGTDNSDSFEFDSRAPDLGLTSDLVQTVIASDIHGGLDYLYNTRTNEKFRMSRLPSERSTALEFFCAASPTALHCLRIISDAVLGGPKRTKVLVMVDIPFIQMEIAAVVAMAGFNVHSMLAGHTDEQRARTCREFNDAKSAIDVLVVSMSLAGAGLDLHRACHTGIFATIHFNYNIHGQGTGRLTRPGQDEVVTWTWVKPVGSYLDYKEMQMLKKYFEQLSAEARLPEHIRGHVRQACIGEMVRNYLNQPFNRLAWIFQHKRLLKEKEPLTRAFFNADKTIRVAFFLSNVAALAIRMTPEEYRASNMVHFEIHLDDMADAWATTKEETPLYRWEDDTDRRITDKEPRNPYTRRRDQVLQELENVDLAALLQEVVGIDSHSDESALKTPEKRKRKKVVDEQGSSSDDDDDEHLSSSRRKSKRGSARKRPKNAYAAAMKTPRALRSLYLNQGDVPSILLRTDIADEDELDDRPTADDEQDGEDFDETQDNTAMITAALESLYRSRPPTDDSASGLSKYAGLLDQSELPREVQGRQRRDIHHGAPPGTPPPRDNGDRVPSPSMSPLTDVPGSDDEAPETDQIRQSGTDRGRIVNPGQFGDEDEDEDMADEDEEQGRVLWDRSTNGSNRDGWVSGSDGYTTPVSRRDKSKTPSTGGKKKAKKAERKKAKKAERAKQAERAEKTPKKSARKDVEESEKSGKAGKKGAKKGAKKRTADDMGSAAEEEEEEPTPKRQTRQRSGSKRVTYAM